MKLVEGVHHVTFLTEDMDRLVAFYERVLDAEKTLDMTEEGLRHVFLEVGPTTVLHPFQFIEGPPLPPAPGTMFQRGRLDHFALWAASREAFLEVRRRVEAEGAADGDVRDMKSMWIMAFNDPDGFYVEVIWRKPGVPDSETLPRAEWTTVELDDSRTLLHLAALSRIVPAHRKEEADGRHEPGIERVLLPRGQGRSGARHHGRRNPA